MAALTPLVPGVRPRFAGLCGAPHLAGAPYQVALGECAMGLNASRRNDLPLYSSDRLAQMVGSGQLALVDRATGYDSLFSESEMGFFASLDELASLLRRMIADLDHLDASIRIFAPELATETIKSRPNPPQHQALRGEVKRIILDALREAEHPITSADIAQRVMGARCLPASDPELRTLFIRRVGQSLHVMRHKGVTRIVEQPGRFQGWVLV